MNRYGQLVLEFNRRHRPVACSQIPDPEAFFAEAGETIAAQISAARDEMLGPRRPGEDLEAYRRRSYQALAMAEETVLADHHLFQPEDPTPTSTGHSPTDEENLEDDPDLAPRYRLLAEIYRAINQPL
jgi:hypothetical protein